MGKKIIFRVVIEVLGKPKEHVNNSLQGYIKNLKENDRYQIINEEYAEIKKQEEQEMWAAFAELDVKAEKIEDLIAFCFDYMPSVIEIIEPKEFSLVDSEISTFLNDLQARLHHVDMLTKQMKMENDNLKRNMGSLLKNNVLVLLNKGNLTSDQLSRLTGVTKDNIEDFLDQLIDEGKIDLKEGIYFLKQKVENN
jgi:hypothetical protein